jgi:phosphoribosylglycinamide formyltransferase-1
VSQARIAILIGPKGRGTNMKALVEACTSGEVPAVVAGLITPKTDSPGAQWAQERGLDVLQVSSKDEDYDDRLAGTLRELGATHICLAGYMRLLPQIVLEAFPNRILNIHPALLPKFGGKGMYGSYVHEAVIAAGETESGCTVHVVTENYDEGPILLQLRCPVEPDDTPESLAARVLELEVLAYKAALKKLIEDERVSR